MHASIPPDHPPHIHHQSQRGRAGGGVWAQPGV